MRIAIVGAGWYGCHLALELKKAGHEVVLYEKNPTIFAQISGSYGIRLHAGPHYPRSVETRKNCHQGLKEFKARYPELVVPHEYSIYGLGKSDADGNPSKVDEAQFVSVCQESESCTIFSPQKAGYTNLITAADIDEPSIALGDKLRRTFTRYLNKAKVEVICNAEVQQIKNLGTQVLVKDKTCERTFDKVINTTSYQAFLPELKDFPFAMEAVYQPCLAMIYEDKKPGARPFSFIVMDGWFPCMMPICDDEPGKKYIVTHGKWTIMGSYETPAKANEILGELSDQLIESQIKPHCEQEMNRFWPEFAQRFKYVGWKGTVLAKLKTKKEFRSAITYENDHIIHVVPGKINNVFDVEREVNALLKQEQIISTKGYSYVKGGVLEQSCEEISEKPSLGENNTCTLQTFAELQKKQHSSTAIIAANLAKEAAIMQLPGNKTPTNNYFILCCLAEMILYSALLALTLFSLPILGIPISIMMSSASAAGLCLSAHSLFSEYRKAPTPTQTKEQASESLANN